MILLKATFNIEILTMDFKISETNKGKKSLIYESYVFRIDNVLKSSDISWRCTNRTCKARLRTDSAMSTIVPVNLSHSHDADERKVERQQLRTLVKRKGADDRTARPSKIIQTELQKFEEQSLQHKDMKSIAQSLYRERRKVFPILPKDRLGVHSALDSMDTNTNKCEQFLYENNSDAGIVIFTCKSNLEFLCNEADELFVDGTFKSCPKFFYQMYSVHGHKNGHFVSLVYALLPGKSENVYQYLWDSIRSSCAYLQLQIKPQIIHIDFEVAMHNVLKTAFPEATIKCCRFHLGQAWWRKIQTLGLSQDYKDSSNEIGKWLKHSFGLHFLRPSDVEDSFCEDVMSATPEDHRCSKYADYLFENYVTSHSKFPPEMWAEIPSNNKRTNNAAESFHAHFNAQFYTAHPTIFVFLEVLLKLQATTYVKMRGTNVVAPYKKTERERNEFILKQYEKYTSGEITRSEYINALGYRVCAVDI